MSPAVVAPLVGRSRTSSPAKLVSQRADSPSAHAPAGNLRASARAREKVHTKLRDKEKAKAKSTKSLGANGKHRRSSKGKSKSRTSGGGGELDTDEEISIERDFTERQATLGVNGYRLVGMRQTGRTVKVTWSVREPVDRPASKKNGAVPSPEVSAAAANGAQKYDWVGLFPTASALYLDLSSYVAYQYLRRGEHEGQVELSLPKHESKPRTMYVVALIRSDEHLSAGGVVEDAIVLDMKRQIGARGLRSDYKVAVQSASTSSVTLLWKAPLSRGSSDFVGLYKPAASDASYEAYSYLRSSGKDSGRIKLDGLSLAKTGTYHVRLVRFRSGRAASIFPFRLHNGVLAASTSASSRVVPYQPAMADTGTPIDSNHDSDLLAQPQPKRKLVKSSSRERFANTQATALVANVESRFRLAATERERLQNMIKDVALIKLEPLERVSMPKSRSGIQSCAERPAPTDEGATTARGRKTTALSSAGPAGDDSSASPSRESAMAVKLRSVADKLRLPADFVLPPTEPIPADLGLDKMGSAVETANPIVSPLYSLVVGVITPTSLSVAYEAPVGHSGSDYVALQRADKAPHASETTEPTLPMSPYQLQDDGNAALVGFDFAHPRGWKLVFKDIALLRVGD
ncbi:uncharacterized protein AMSG_10962 [Thecamonas trahens ATCC 50062]|uniref:Uncharacterized protein n=1 Tax=Thecamonas trahens ATCC 50062 TaxID=461836 RepID=A0A0L0DSW6_THETB|nr:hypothetical protein AMSG_10962 [Thecamonas trahens ATCC 50062]KNC55317.1 hypothetical protein AMSG_10962 [Thecamonas trahens ATCC 50062]|eukprot:XP_013753040.1 hypothetical protein AMSG_10962 [Thecamonas trahens ATCC 50062]